MKSNAVDIFIKAHDDVHFYTNLLFTKYYLWECVAIKATLIYSFLAMIYIKYRNPSIFISKEETHTQRLQNLYWYVQVGILGDYLKGSLMFYSTLHGQVYLKIQNDTINSLMTEKLERNPDLLEKQIVFLPHGVLPYCIAIVRHWIITLDFFFSIGILRL